MSIGLVSVGQRLLKVRTERGYPQSKMAAILGIADKSYNNYESGKRELPLSVAVKFCKEFDQNLGWLVYGTALPSISSAAKVSAEICEAVLGCVERSEKTYTHKEVAKFMDYLMRQCLSKGSSPAEEANQFFSVIE